MSAFANCNPPVYRCSHCTYTGKTRTSLLHHLQMIHSGEQNFRVYCGINNCQASYQIINSLKKHIRRKHGTHYLTAEESCQQLSTTCSHDDNIDLNDMHLTEEPNLPSAPEIPSNQLSLPETKSDLLKTFIMIQLKIKQMHAVPGSVINLVTTEIFQLLRSYNENLFWELKSSAQEREANCPSNCQNNILSKLKDNQDSLIELLLSGSSAKAQYDFARNNLGLIEGKRCNLGKSGSREDFYYYVPILKSLEFLLRNQDILAEVKNGHKQETNSYMHDYCDGSLFAGSEIFSKDPNALQIQLYYDDFEIVNPIGTYTKKHKLSACYFTLGNIRPKFRSKLKLIQLVWLCKTDLVKKYGLEKVATPLVSDLTQLETVGIQITTDEVTEIFRGSVTMVVADNLGSHGIGGFNESFSGFRICRFCMCTSEELSRATPPNNFIERTPSSYNAQLQLIKDDDHMKTTYGLRKNSPFNCLRYFHVTEGLPPDLGHDLFEGVCPEIISKVLSYFIAEKLTSLKEVNDIISSFPYMVSDKSNRPSTLLWSGGRVVVKQKAAQMWCLMRLIFIMLGNVIPTGNDHWQLLLHLREICDVATSPVHTPDTLIYLEDTVFDFLDLYKTLYPLEKLTPKMHYLQHYSRQIERFGPLCNCWTLRYEAKHSVFKTLVRSTQNMKNIVYTLTTRHQLKQAVAFAGEETLSDELSFTGGHILNIADMPLTQQGIIKHEIGNVTEVYCVTGIKSEHRQFYLGCCLMLFTVSFDDHVDFTNVLSVCSENNLDVTDTVILEKNAIVFFNIESFLYTINLILEKNIKARVHFVNVD
ncbi:hypothetical protein HOLleu_12090 [Holothuria leucospilota]|uniref:C2H2-type domain-containing protein n=1 Tax=Holothuria leucospilota TaxID=206669 RepID=A0A9Q1CAC3_HOLLE|nr:hypothetical protein HOLleu_12090 [Holothuria leucospilota]